MEKLKLAEILKNKHILRLCIILFIGVLLLAFGGNTGKKAKADIAQDVPSMQPYAETERRLETILSKIKGVGDVEVMLTYDGTGKRTYVKETERTQSRAETQSSSSESISVLVPEDAPVLEAEVYPKVRGVIAVAEGAGSASVREQIVLALKAVLEVEEHRIGVFAK